MAIPRRCSSGSPRWRTRCRASPSPGGWSWHPFRGSPWSSNGRSPATFSGSCRRRLSRPPVTAPAGVPRRGPHPPRPPPAVAPTPVPATPTELDVPTAGAVGVEDARESDGEATADVVELFRSGALNPKTMAEGSFERRIVERFGPDVVIADITATLRGDSWPEALVEHADSGLRVRDRAELLQRWFESSEHPPDRRAGMPPISPCGGWPPLRRWGTRPSVRWPGGANDGITRSWWPGAGGRASLARPPPRSARGRRVLAPRRVTIPKGIDAALWGLPVDLLVEWATWVFKLWPGAPIEYVLPVGTPEPASAWYDRARPVAELAVKTWIPFSGVDDELGKAAQPLGQAADQRLRRRRGPLWPRGSREARRWPPRPSPCGWATPVRAVGDSVAGPPWPTLSTPSDHGGRSPGAGAGSQRAGSTERRGQIVGAGGLTV